MAEAVASVFTAHSKRTSVPRITFMSVGLVTMRVGSERRQILKISNSRISKFASKSPLTFDLNAGLVLISTCYVADNAEVGSLVHNLNVPYLQSPITVDLKTVSFQIPLPILGPEGNKMDPDSHPEPFINLPTCFLTISAQEQENQKNGSLRRRGSPLQPSCIHSWTLKYAELHLEKRT